MERSTLQELTALHAVLDNGCLDDAERLFDSLGPANAGRGQAALALANGWLRAGQTARATPYCRILRTAPDTAATATTQLAQLHLQWGRHDDARRLIGPHPATLAQAALMLLATMEDDEAAWAMAQAAFERDWAGHPLAAALTGPPPDTAERRDGDIAHFWWAAARLRRCSGGGANTHDCLRRAIDAAPWRLDWYLELAGALFADMAPHLFGRHWLSLPVTFAGSWRWLLLTCRAHMLMGPNTDAALACCRTAQTLDPSRWQAFQAEAQIMSDFACLDHVDKSFRQFWNGKAKPPADPAGRDAPHARHRAARASRRAITLAPTAANWNDLGATLFAGGAMEAATDAFGQALVLDPRQRHAAINVAVTLLELGQFDALRHHMAHTEFLAPLPKSLQPMLRRADATDPDERWPDIWRMKVDYQEWLRRTVFSQSWWRELGEGR